MLELIVCMIRSFGRIKKVWWILWLQGKHYLIQEEWKNEVANIFKDISGKIGITLDAFWAEPKDNTKAADRDAAERYLQMHVSFFDVFDFICFI